MFEETSHKAERLVGHRVQKVVPLLLVVIGVSGGVADDAYAEERYFLQIARLGYGGRLHLTGQTIGVHGFNGRLTGSVGNKLVTGAHQAIVHAQIALLLHFR